MVRKFFLCALAASAGCSFGDDRSMQNGDGGPDGKPDGMVQEKDHLLLTEIMSEGAENSEFIEIWNPTSRDISLANYYLSDYGNYWRLPVPATGTAPLQPVQSDFVVGFPADAVLRSKQVITVAMKTSEFQNTFSTAATYGVDIAADEGGTKAFRFRLVGSVPTITDSGEPIALFYWDGQSDLVKDVDLAFAGKIDSGVGATNRYVTKGAIDGPDANNAESAYEPESGSFGGGMSAAVPNLMFQSYKRRTFETGSETQSGTGNGITGDDESSEALPSTWDGDAATPFTAPTPGTAPTI